MKNKVFLLIFLRYLLIAIIALFSLPAIYFLFKTITIYSSLSIITRFYDAYLLPGTATLFVEGNYINIVEACIGVSAYYFLIIINLSLPMPIKQRVKSMFFLIFSFFVLNVIRISLFTALFVSGFSLFDLTHKFFWYFGSTILVVSLWFFSVQMFKIKFIPFYSDIKNIFKHSSLKRKVK